MLKVKSWSADKNISCYIELLQRHCKMNKLDEPIEDENQIEKRFSKKTTDKNDEWKY